MRLVVIGTGGHARALVAVAQTIGIWQIIELVDLNFNNQTESILGAPVIGAIEMLELLDKENLEIIIAMGDNKIRKKIFSELKSQKYQFCNVIHPSAVVHHTAKMGEGNFIGPFSHLGPLVKLGDGCIINSYCNVEHESEICDFGHIAPCTVVCGRCFIGEGVFIGANACLIDNIHVADGTIIGAGSTILKNIVDVGRTFVGNPARPL